MKLNRKRILFFVMLTVLLSAVFVFAADPTASSADDSWTTFWTFLLKWVTRIGEGVALFGGIQVAFSFGSDNPDARIRGLQFVAAGMITIGIGVTPGLFGVI